MRHIALALMVMALVNCGGQKTEQSGGLQQEGTVYVTSTGKKYHRDGCKWLKSRSPMALSKAVAAGYQPCKVCKPPTK